MPSRRRRGGAVSEAARAAAERGGRGPRAPRLESLVRRAVGEILAGGAAPGGDPELAEARLAVTSLELSPDMRFARVRVLPLAAAAGIETGRLEALQEALDRAAPAVSRELARRVRLKRTPRLRLSCDLARLESLRLEDRLRAGLGGGGDGDGASDDDGGEGEAGEAAPPGGAPGGAPGAA